MKTPSRSKSIRPLARSTSPRISIPPQSPGATGWLVGLLCVPDAVDVILVAGEIHLVSGRPENLDRTTESLGGLIRADDDAAVGHLENGTTIDHQRDALGDLDIGAVGQRRATAADQIRVTVRRRGDITIESLVAEHTNNVTGRRQPQRDAKIAIRRIGPPRGHDADRGEALVNKDDFVGRSSLGEEPVTRCGATLNQKL